MAKIIRLTLIIVAAGDYSGFGMERMGAWSVSAVFG